MVFANMELYSKPTCPFCHKVLAFMDANDIEMPIHDSRESQNAERLMELNGTTQVPCLVIDGKPMLESDDIIAYLQTLL